MNNQKAEVRVSVTCKCGSQFEGSASTDKHMVSCPQCRSYVDVVNSTTFNALASCDIRFCQQHILETAINRKVAKVIR